MEYDDRILVGDVIHHPAERVDGHAPGGERIDVATAAALVDRGDATYCEACPSAEVE